MRSKSACGDSFLHIFVGFFDAESCFCFRGSRLLGKKNGIPLYPNLVNLKSNTMKNTLQRYDGCFLHASDLQEKISECYEFNLNYDFVKVLSCKNGFLLIRSVGRGDDGALLRHPQKPMAKNRARSIEQVFGKCAANQTSHSETVPFPPDVQTRRRPFPLLSPCSNPRKGLSFSYENKSPSQILFLRCLKSYRFAADGSATRGRE